MLQRCPPFASQFLRFRKRPDEEHVYQGQDGDNVLELLRNRFGGDKIAMNGFLYVRTNHHSNRVYWVCHRSDCRGTLNTDEQVLQGTAKAAHCHPPEHVAVDKLKAENRIHELALSSDAKPSEILNEILPELSSEVLELLPARGTLMQKISRIRAREAEGRESGGRWKHRGKGAFASWSRMRRGETSS